MKSTVDNYEKTLYIYIYIYINIYIHIYTYIFVEFVGLVINRSTTKQDKS